MTAESPDHTSRDAEKELRDVIENYYGKVPAADLIHILGNIQYEIEDNRFTDEVKLFD